MKRALFISFFLIILSLAGPAAAEDDVQYWSQYLFKVVDTEHVDFKIFTEYRFYDDVDDLGLSLVQFKLSYHFWKYLDLGTNYTYLNFRTTNSLAGDFEDKYQHRAELEVNPKWKINDRVSFYNRNRIEFRWIEDKGSYNTRSRHRVGLTFPVEVDWAKWLNAYYVDSEFFYNWAENDYDEYRSVPLGLKFKLSKQCSLNTYYMIQGRKGSQDWRSNQILGTLLSYTF